MHWNSTPHASAITRQRWLTAGRLSSVAWLTAAAALIAFAGLRTRKPSSDSAATNWSDGSGGSSREQGGSSSQAATSTQQTLTTSAKPASSGVGVGNATAERLLHMTEDLGLLKLPQKKQQQLQQQQEASSSGGIRGQLEACLKSPEVQTGQRAASDLPYSLQHFRKGVPGRLELQLLLDSERQPDIDAVTAVAGTSLSRLDRLPGLCASWGGHLSAAVYIGIQAGAAPGEMLAQLSAALEAVQTVFDSAEEGPAGSCALRIGLWSEQLAGPGEAKLFPFNALRNAAIIAATSELILTTDVDMLLSVGLTKLLRRADRLEEIRAAAMQKRFLVIPAFQAPTSAAAAADAAAGGKAAVLQGLLKQQLQRAAPHYQAGHSAVDYRRWMGADKPYTANWSEGWEPFGIVARRLVPPFDARFRGYGNDKVVWVEVLQHMGYSFVVDPEGFMVHRPHVISVVRKSFLAGNPSMTVRAQAVSNKQGANAAKSQRNGNPLTPSRLSATARVAAGAADHKTQPVTVEAAMEMASQAEESDLLPHGLVFNTGIEVKWAILRRVKEGKYKPVVGQGYGNCRHMLPWWNDVRVEDM